MSFRRTASSSNKKKEHPREPFSPEEDIRLVQLVQFYGIDNWGTISKHMVNRSARQCKDRWINFLSPGLNKNPWTQEEDDILLEKYQEMGSQWKVISKFFKGRTHIAIRNRMLKLKRHMERKEECREAHEKFEGFTDSD